MGHGFPNQVPHLTWCDNHQKKAFTKANAKKLIRVLSKNSAMRQYPCTYINAGWHVGHLPLAVVQGRMTADEVYGPEAA